MNIPDRPRLAKTGKLLGVFMLSYLAGVLFADRADDAAWWLYIISFVAAISLLGVLIREVWKP